MSNIYRQMSDAAFRFAADERGNDAVEYGLILGLISLLIVGGATTVGTNLQTLFTTAGTDLTKAVAGM